MLQVLFGTVSGLGVHRDPYWARCVSVQDRLEGHVCGGWPDSWSLCHWRRQWYLHLQLIGSLICRENIQNDSHSTFDYLWWRCFTFLHGGFNFVWIVFVEVQFNMIQNEKGTQAQDVNVVVAPEQASYFGEIKSFNPTKGRWDEERSIVIECCTCLSCSVLFFTAFILYIYTVYLYISDII